MSSLAQDTMAYESGVFFLRHALNHRSHGIRFSEKQSVVRLKNKIYQSSILREHQTGDPKRRSNTVQSYLNQRVIQDDEPNRRNPAGCKLY